MTKNEPVEVRKPYTHIITLTGETFSHFAYDFIDKGDFVEFLTETKKGEVFKRTVNKNAISNIAERQ